MCPSSGVSFIFPVAFVQFLTTLFSFLSLSLLFLCVPQIVYSFLRLSLFPIHSFLLFQHCRLVLPDPFHLETWHASIGCIWGSGGFRKLLTHSLSHTHTRIFTFTYTSIRTDRYTLSFSIELVHWTLLLEMLASWGNYLGLSLDLSSNSAACSLDSHWIHLTRNPDHFPILSLPETFH